MPTRARRVCPHCRTVLTGAGGCPTCRARREARTPDYAYTDPAWRARAAAYLSTHPWCVLCGARATIPDHYPVRRRDLVRMGSPDPDTDDHLRPLCARCHGRETAKRQPGGRHQPE